MLQASGFQGTVITVNTALLACTKVTWLEGVELLVQRKRALCDISVYSECISMCFTSFRERNHPTAPIAPIAEVDSARLSSGSWLWSWDRLRATPATPATPSAAVWCPMLAEWPGRCRCSEKCWVNWRRPGG